jgi:predicted phosphodiesterase
MRVALIADIHGNDVALERVLHSIEDDEVEQIVCLGDVAGTGPQPAAVVERLRATGCRVVMGNVDHFLIEPVRPPVADDDFMSKIYDIDEWCCTQLSRDQLDYVASFEDVAEVVLDDGSRLLCYHGSPNSFDDIIRESTSSAELDDFFAGLDHSVFAGGHTHFQMLRRHRATIVINSGSVGMAYDRTHPDDEIGYAPWAEYALVTSEGGALSVAFRRVPVDKSEVARAVETSGMPHAEWLASEWAR